MSTSSREQIRDKSVSQSRMMRLSVLLWQFGRAFHAWAAVTAGNALHTKSHDDCCLLLVVLDFMYIYVLYSLFWRIYECMHGSVNRAIQCGRGRALNRVSLLGVRGGVVVMEYPTAPRHSSEILVKVCKSQKAYNVELAFSSCWLNCLIRVVSILVLFGE